MADKLRVGMVGGGNESFMGRIHRLAMERCGCVELVCGAFGTTRQRSFETGKTLALPTRRTYGIYRDLLKREQSAKEDGGMDFLTVVAPNNMHYPVAMAAFDAGFSVLCEKPMTNNMDEALNLKRKLMMTGMDYGVAYVYPFYPVVRRARELVAEGAIGTIRRVVAEYPLGWMAARLETAGNRQAGWRTDPRRAGAAGAIIDLAEHCAYLAEYVTGQPIAEVSADARSCIAGRLLDDDCAMLVRFAPGFRGVFFASQVATGEVDGLRIRVYGDKGALAWSQGAGDQLVRTALDGTVEILREGTPTTRPEACCRQPYGDDEAYIDALAATYKTFADQVVAHKSGKKPAVRCCTVDEALRAVAFADAVTRNISSDPDKPAEKWTPVVVPEVQVIE